MKVEKVAVGFCENGAGYGGAIISLAAFLENVPNEFNPHIYTGIGTEAYQQLGKLGQWQHLPATSLVDQAWLKKTGVPFASTIDNIFNLLPLVLKYYRVFKRHSIEIVYLNNDASCNMAAAAAAKLAGIPLILHARGFHADTKGNRWVLGQLQHCIAVSNAVKSELLQLGLPPEKCTVVPEGLNMALFHPRPPADALRKELGLSDTVPVITLVGGLIDWKGQDILLDACPMILEKFPDAQILLVGSAYGKDDLFADMIAKKAASPALKANVRLLGSRTDIPDILSISTIVLHASTKPEPFGRTFLEGMAMGKPVIASNEGGPLDVIQNEVDGLLIAPRDPHILATAIKRLLSDPVFSEAMGKNAAEKASAYSIENHVEAVSAILRNTVRHAV